MNDFTVEQLSPRVWRIKDCMGVAMYLAAGDNKACLMDTGYGVKGLRELTESLCHLPVTVWLTHAHYDHAFGAFEFGQAYMNPLDFPLFHTNSQPDFRERVIAHASPNLSLEQMQRGDLKLLPLNDGDTLELGGLTVEAHHVPGHTKGTMIFLLREERMVLFGDACGPGTMLVEDAASPISDYLKALMQLKRELEPHYDIILRNHGTCISGKELLDNVIDVCNDILTHRDDKVPVPDEVKELFFNCSSLPVYRAKRLSADLKRLDGKEGNILYSEEKAQ